jgi:uncharacterized protein (TIGR03435 family)
MMTGARHIGCSLLLLGIAASGLGQNVFVGKPAPVFEVTSLTKAGVKENNQTIRGSVTVLEFWATWCAPCVEAMPHLNDLAEKFKGKVRFLSLSDETPEKVRNFMKKRPFKTEVALVSPKLRADAFKIEYIPSTWIIGTDGRVLAVTEPTKLTEQILEDALAGKVLESLSDVPVLDVTETSKFMLDFRIGVSKEDKGGFSGYLESHTYGQPPADLIADVFGVLPTRVRLQAEFPFEKYQLYSKRPPTMTPEQAQEMMRTLVPTTLGIKCEWVEEEVPVYVVSAPEGIKGTLLRSKESNNAQSSDGAGVFYSRNNDFALICNYIELQTKTPVFDETGLSGRYDLQILHEEGNTESMFEELRKCGLAIRQERRKVRFLRVTPMS